MGRLGSGSKIGTGPKCNSGSGMNDLTCGPIPGGHRCFFHLPGPSIFPKGAGGFDVDRLTHLRGRHDGVQVQGSRAGPKTFVSLEVENSKTPGDKGVCNLALSTYPPFLLSFHGHLPRQVVFCPFCRGDISSPQRKDSPPKPVPWSIAHGSPFPRCCITSHRRIEASSSSGVRPLGFSHAVHPEKALQRQQCPEAREGRSAFALPPKGFRGIHGYGSTRKQQGTASFGPCFHLAGFHFGYAFLTHNHILMRTSFAQTEPPPFWRLQARGPLARVGRKAHICRDNLKQVDRIYLGSKPLSTWQTPVFGMKRPSKKDVSYSNQSIVLFRTERPIQLGKGDPPGQPFSSRGCEDF